MPEFNDSQYFQKDGHYCAKCVGNRDNHAPGCIVPYALAEGKKAHDLMEEETRLLAEQSERETE